MIYDGIMVGILPAAIMCYRQFALAPSLQPPVLEAFAVFMLSGGVLWTASETWGGGGGARLVLVGLTTIYYAGLMVGADYTVDLASLVYTSNSSLEQTLRVIRSLFWIALHGWYLLYATRAYFGEEGQ
jgi:hypothetical protein